MATHELEEQIESEDRAESLEETLKNTQDRADELEYQLLKLRQVRHPGFMISEYRMIYFGRHTSNSRSNGFASLANCIRRPQLRPTGRPGTQRWRKNT